MKFISKNRNYRVVLRPGVPAEPMTGRHAVPGIYIKFENGEVTVDETFARRLGMKLEELIEMIKFSSGYGKDGDFMALEDEEIDSFKETLNPYRSSEPEHDLINVEYGHVGKNLNPKPKMNLTADQSKMIAEMATSMAKEMAPKMAMELLNRMAENKTKENSKQEDLSEEPCEEKKEDEIEEPVAVKKKPGRPPKSSVNNIKAT